MNSYLIPTDFSQSANTALSYALSIDRSNPIKIILLNCYQLLPSTSEIFISIDDILKENSEKGLKKSMSDLKGTHSSREIDFELISKCGSLRLGIKDVLSKYEVDYVVMGTHGASGLEKILVGSNASEILSNIGKSVIVVPENKLFKPLKNIILALEMGEELDTGILKKLKNVAEVHRSHIDVITVLPQDNFDQLKLDRFRISASRALEDFHHEFHLLKHDDVIDGIESFISSHDVDLIAIVPHKHSFFEGMLHKSVSKTLAMKSKIPMLALG